MWRKQRCCSGGVSRTRVTAILSFCLTLYLSVQVAPSVRPRRLRMQPQKAFWWSLFLAKPMAGGAATLSGSSAAVLGWGARLRLLGSHDWGNPLFNSTSEGKPRRHPLPREGVGGTLFSAGLELYYVALSLVSTLTPCPVCVIHLFFLLSPLSLFSYILWKEITPFETQI